MPPVVGGAWQRLRSVGRQPPSQTACTASVAAVNEAEEGGAMFTRRQFLGRTAAAGAGLFLVSGRGGIERIRLPAAPDGAMLDPAGIPKYGRRLVAPPALPGRALQTKDLYPIAVTQLEQQILPPRLPAADNRPPLSARFPSPAECRRWGRE